MAFLLLINFAVPVKTRLAFAPNASFQEEMLKSGMAYYRKSAANCPNHLAFEKAEKLAIAQDVTS
ncbi:hypothetical protein [Nostoc sp. ATCC 53789]|uniref:hypothetical protein n=1 Tax=Nostoc sp. ATCC 53789 TaxID=76335 RepID=UPI000DECA5DE|nr:hypothetical protein [Nostoc sp. ATCC 53789]QHG21258.1 hypothetical protein GJB62_36035 [Nostoc sp. ATCC 53789]RCJ16649.1 hypothetical protein A6V25_30615 [Nostoc sp. ATCC 53789]